MPDYLFDKIDYIKDIINKINKIILFLDYDGTLISFKDRPHDVITSKEVEMIISKLIKMKGYKVVIVTGRTLSDIKKLIDLKGLSYAALHGLQIELSSGGSYDWKVKDNIKNILEKIIKQTKKRFQKEKGVFLEDKGYTFAFHYRMVDDNKINYIVKNFLELIYSIDNNSKLDILQGSKVIEIRPKGWNKGKAVELITSKIESKNHLPIYIGDDITDEDAFQSLNDKGITIYVSNNSGRKTTAKYWLEDPEDVINFLKMIQVN